ncbi:MAG TPA: carboxy terminal-processing peptidase [Verrucomicrobiae bacterium]|nr:carboxy terminal-processing peptidase [Verrucomicrobiae bacterium]
MIHPTLFRARIWLLAFVGATGLCFSVAADTPDTVAPTTNSWRLPRAEAEDGQIAFWTAYLLQKYHYSHQPFDDRISSQFLDSYLEALDPQHMHFLQSDLNGFDRYRTNLDNMLVTRSGTGDVSPGFEVFGRYIERLRERVEYVDELLKKEKFEFNTDERIAVDRRESPYPADLNEARELWRQRLRFEYLQEKLTLQDKKAKADKGESKPDAEPEVPLHDKIVDTLSHRNTRALKRFADWDKNDILGIYLTALSRVYDPHSDYFNRTQLEQFKISMNLQLFGIGAELRAEDGYCKVAKLLPGGPAMKSKKINAEDLIVAVAQSNAAPVDVVDMDLTKIVQMIRGPKGTLVRLTLAPAGKKSERTEITLIRDEIPLEDQAAKGRIIDMPNGKGVTRLGVITLPSFYAPMLDGSAAARKDVLGKYTSIDVAKLLSKFKQENVKGVILDLRYNGGGSLEEAIKVTGLFIKEGPVVQVRDMDGTVQVDKDTDSSVAYDGPLIVFTSRFSASASEIVAGALQDYGRALIVGDISTHGKGTVQTVQSLRPLMRLSETDPEPGALKFTIRKFYRASGGSTQLEGVNPDIVLPSRFNYSKDIGERALDNPMPWDEISSAKYTPVNTVQPYLAELLKRFTHRISTNQDFVYIREDIEEYRKAQADRTISLNEQQRIKEQEEAEQRQKARDKELRARKESEEKVYELTLKQAELPGLPAPLQKTNTVASAELDEMMELSAALGDHVAKDDEDDEEKLLTFDWNAAYLQEAQRIMVDYLDLLAKPSPIAANQRELNPAISTDRN